MEELKHGRLIMTTNDGKDLIIEVCRLSDSEIILYRIEKESFLKYDPLNMKLSDIYADSGI